MTVNGGRFIDFLNGGFSSGSGNTNYNFVTINDGTFDYWVEGGWATYGNANYNTMIINGGTFDGVIVDGGYTGVGNTNYNTVTINGGTFTNSGTDRGIYGGYVADSGNAIGNTVNINGGEISGYIYGGYVGSSGTVENNSINIYGSPNLTDAFLVAARSSTNSYGNSVNIYTSGITAKNISGFESLNFFIPDDATDGSKVLLTLTDSDKTDLKNTRVNIGAVGSGNVIPTSNLTLLTTDVGIEYDEATTFGEVLSQGVSVLYPAKITVSEDEKSIIAQINGEGKINSKLDIIGSTPVQNIVIPTIPDDMGGNFEEFDLNDNEISNDTDSEDEQKNIGSTDSPDNKGWNVFGNVGGGPMRFKGANGSYVDTTSQNIDLGFARSINYTETDRTTIAPVIDYQNTNYDSYLKDGTHGRGNSKYTGFGFVMRNMKRSGTYFEGSLKYGRTNTEFASDNLDPTGAFGTVTYETSAAVYSGHAKIGKYFRLNRNNLLNVYGFYNHTLQGSSNADLSSGEHYKFSSANSGRVRIGYRLTTRTSKISQFYTGLAYQFEYNTGVSAKYREYSTPGDSYNGSSGMLEMGWLVKPFRGTPWTVDVNATGWIGYQRGVKAMAKVQKSF